jgi:hypothetical protein
LGVYGDWYLPSTFELNCLANNSAIVNRVIAQYAADKSIRLNDEDIYTQTFDPIFGGYIWEYIGTYGASMSLFLNSSPGYWTSTEYDQGTAYYLSMGSSGVMFATASKSNALLNVRPFRTDVRIWNDFDNVWVTQGNTGVNTLTAFDYIIVTYFFADNLYRDIDTCTHFSGTGIATLDNIPLGCGYNPGPLPIGSVQNTSYLYWGGDDNANGKGESVVINFNNLKNGQPTSNRNISLNLRASWHSSNAGDLVAMEVTTYIGGVLSDVFNTIQSTGTVVQRVRSPFRPVGQATCGANGYTNGSYVVPTNLNYRPLLGKIDYNLDTKVSSITFY